LLVREKSQIKTRGVIMSVGDKKPFFLNGWSLLIYGGKIII
jgi:hypothetical protein